ncbi:MAG: MarR family transcriptional regulator [Anaerolineales bacterium]|nr:MarR family transcriptional regulator [Anaerolineales bacterium]MCZ2121443.1 MarR family transcriptional regulator [Anaerolineales bacterium]
MARITKTEYEILSAFRYALRQFLRFSEEAAQSMGLTPQQHQALLSIKGFPGRDKITVKELSERMQIQHHSAVGLVNRLEAQGLLTREPSRADRRQVYVKLSAQGTALLEQLSSIHKEELHRMLPELQKLFEQLSGDKSDLLKTL